MHDTYLLLTPFLMLIVVGLVGFVGCDVVFGLDPVDDQVDPPRNLTAVPGTNKIDLKWDPPVKGDPITYTVKRGRMTRAYTLLSDPPIDASTTSFTDTRMIEDGMTYFYAVSATLAGDKETPNSDELPVVAGLAGKAPLLSVTAMGNPRNDFTGWAGVGILVGPAPIEIKELARIKLAGNTQPHNVRIIDGDSPTHADVSNGGVVVNMAGATDGEFVYAPLAVPVLLNANANYYILSQETNGGDRYYNADVTQVMAVASVARVYAAYGDGVSYNASPTSGFSYVPVNAYYSV